MLLINCLSFILIIQIGGDQEEERRALEGANNISCNFCMIYRLPQLDGGLEALEHVTTGDNFTSRYILTLNKLI